MVYIGFSIWLFLFFVRIDKNEKYFEHLTFQGELRRYNRLLAVKIKTGITLTFNM